MIAQYLPSRLYYGCLTLAIGLLTLSAGAQPLVPAVLIPPVASDAPGYPSRAGDLDVRPGFQQPPAGYGQVPFWWWTGDPLDKDRLLWQIEELHKKGIPGMQVNYAHEDTPGWPTYPNEPEIFTPQWWDIWKYVAGECSKRGMGIGLSGYTIDWPNGKSLVSRTIYNDPEIQGRPITVAQKVRPPAGQPLTLAIPADWIGLRAYPVAGQSVAPGGIDLAAQVRDNQLTWTPPAGQWEVWLFTAPRKPGTLNPMHPQAGQRIIDRFFQPFQDNAPGQSAAGLNYFFHDELQFGVGDHIWTDDFIDRFRAAKGYDLFEVLPALFTDIGPVTPKARLDFMDVRVRLAEERYFIPIFNWHWSRGKIYGCDQGGRGRDPSEFGDYFSAVRWYTAPGHDTPGGHADLIKGKVSSSIAHLYQRPRVWLEGYHSFGWGASPEQLMVATRENYLYGCTLLNLHGLYYTTHGSFWEWAPPCYHFRMPYWDHMDTFFRYFERLSYLFSQGVHQSEIAILYPVTPHQAGLDGNLATNTAFDCAGQLFPAGYDFVFMDDPSLERAEIRDGRLWVAGAGYRVLVLPAMQAVRWATLQKAQAFFAAGGTVIAIGALPTASDRAGRDDAMLDGAVHTLFGLSAAQARPGQAPAAQTNPAGGLGLLAADSKAALAALTGRIERPVSADKPVRAMHRKIGPRDVFMVMDAPKGSHCTFRATGIPELWDAWTGETSPLTLVATSGQTTTVVMPLEDYEAQVVVFSPGQPPMTAKTAAPLPATVQTVEGDWQFELKPTLDNRWGDFRLPVEETIIGPEARIFKYARETGAGSNWQQPGFDDSQWARVTHDFGPKFWKLGPLPREAITPELDTRLAALTQIDPAQPVRIGDRDYRWSSYDFSWRWGKQGDPGHQGWHGLKENVTDDFICLGQPKGGQNETLYVAEPEGACYYLWTSAVTPRDQSVHVQQGGLQPATFWLNGLPVKADALLPLRQGGNPLLLRYDNPGRGHFVLHGLDSRPEGPRTPLAMRWYDQPAVIPYDVWPAAPTADCYRFVAPPGLRAMTVTAFGNLQAWAAGQPLPVETAGPAYHGATRYEVRLPQTLAARSLVAFRIQPIPGLYAGSALPEPVRLDCGPGAMPLGDWSQGSVLETYSGGGWYRKTVALTAGQTQGKTLLHLGSVAATAEVHVNGQPAGVRVAPPWTVDITRFVKPGDNQIEILVYNTLANHYRTIPTRYNTQPPRSGLIGPVQLEFQPE